VPLPPRTDPAFTRLASALLALLMALIVAQNIAVQDLWFTDEIRVAGMILQMADSHQYIAPYAGTQPFVEKPPLITPSRR
jgi:4-amino-4-deoxy-L-arabinose transferase-like glycosyltransferase